MSKRSTRSQSTPSRDLWRGLPQRGRLTLDRLQSLSPHRRHRSSNSDKSSVESLVWDTTGLHDVKFGAGDSRFTHWSGLGSPLFSLSGQLFSTPPHFRPRVSTFGRRSSGGEVEVAHPKMDDENVKIRHRTAIEYAALVLDDDLKDLVLDETTYERIKELSIKAERLKTTLQDAQVFLRTHDREDFTANYEELGTRTKIGLLEFIKTSQSYLRNNNQSTTEESVGTTGATNIKKARVTSHLQTTLSCLGTLSKEFTDITETEPTNDVEFRRMEDTVKSLQCSHGLIYDEARQLCNDATETGMAKESALLESALQSLKTLKLNSETHTQKAKTKLGIIGVNGKGLSDEVKPPVFSGEPSDRLDYYSFKQQFEEYMKNRAYSNAETLSLLQKTCLVGTARLACANFTKVEDIWSYL